MKNEKNDQLLEALLMLTAEIRAFREELRPELRRSETLRREAEHRAEIKSKISDFLTSRERISDDNKC